MLRFLFAVRFCGEALVLICLVLASQSLFASPATFVTALPVAKNQILARFNWDPTFSTEDLSSYQFPFDLAYGITGRWTVFTTFSLSHSSMNVSHISPADHLTSGGWDDTLAFVRYTLFSVDKPASTFRIAPLVGLFLPTGDNGLHNSSGLFPQSLQTGSGSVDPYGGVAVGWNGMKYGLAGDSTFRHNPVTPAGSSPGDEFRADAEEEARLYPIHSPQEGLPSEIWLSLEQNFKQDSRSSLNGLASAGTGGKSFFQDAVLEYATLHYELGAGIQFPVFQNLNGAPDLREKRQLLFFSEYYFSGFTRRRR